MSRSGHCLQHIFAVGILAILTHAASYADDWPAWRGPMGNGISSESVAPMKWSASENIAWRIEIPGRGRSSPIVTGDRVFVTTGVDEDQSRRVICIDRADGRILWSKSVHTGPGGKMHQDNTMASSTPATDGERVFAVFVDDRGMKVVALDMDGNLLWNSTPELIFQITASQLRR